MNENSNYVISCPGCTLSFKKKEECIEHLLQHCLKPRIVCDKENQRSKSIQWISEYFYGCCKTTETSFDSRITYSRNLKRNNKKLDYCSIVEKKPRLVVKVPKIPNDLQCPVCEKFFYPAKACCKHLFSTCLYTDKLQDAAAVRKWLGQYLWFNNKKSIEVVDLTSDHSNTICKYCKVEMRDKILLVEHMEKFHRQESVKDGHMCVICNFKVSSYEEMAAHLIVKHIKCGCEHRSSTFKGLSSHLHRCSKSVEVKCPVFKEVEWLSFDTESHFRLHLLNCKRKVMVDLSIENLFFKCDVCRKRVLKFEFEVHLSDHLKLNTSYARCKNQSLISLSSLKDALSLEDFQKFSSLFN